MEVEQEYLELVRLKGEIAELKRNRKSGRSRPHKLVLMLAVLDMAEEGLLNENRIRFDDWLIGRFERYFDRYKQQGDRCQPQYPFFYLRTSPFWRHKVRLGQEEAYQGLDNSAPGSAQIRRIVEHAYEATLAEWIRECKRTGLYEQGKLLYEKGGLNLDRLGERAVAEVEEDYNVCVRNLARMGDGKVGRMEG